MQYDLQYLKQIITSSQHCQRNWDLTQHISDEHLQMLIYAVTQCPSKQNNAWYQIHVITNRNIISNIHQHTHGFGFADGTVTNNPQTLANTVIVFETLPPSNKFIKSKTAWNLPSNNTRDHNIMSIGIASGYLNLVCHMIGYQSGFCSCFDKNKIMQILDLQNEPFVILGIGFADKTRNRLEHHLDPSIIFPAIPKDPINVRVIK